MRARSCRAPPPKRPPLFTRADGQYLRCSAAQVRTQVAADKANSSFDSCCLSPYPRPKFNHCMTSPLPLFPSTDANQRLEALLVVHVGRAQNDKPPSANQNAARIISLSLFRGLLPSELRDKQNMWGPFAKHVRALRYSYTAQYPDLTAAGKWQNAGRDD